MKRLSKQTVIVLLMLMILIGQSMANTVLFYVGASCVHHTMNSNMSMMSHDNMSSSEEMDNHNLTMLSNNDQSVLMDCCQDQCNCQINSCSNISLLFSMNYRTDITSEQKIAQLASLHLSHFNSNLYRPPIS